VRAKNRNYSSVEVVIPWLRCQSELAVYPRL